MKEIKVIKNIYFVRHGQSVDNKLPVYQSIDSPLSDRGYEQAEKVAERASKIDFEILISSPQARAKDTAECISKKTGKEIKYSDLFVERIKPSFINGKLHDDIDAKKIAEKWTHSLFTSGVKTEDGENFDEIIRRADTALDYLLKLPEKSVFVVTHGFFLRTIIARVLLGETMSEENFKKFHHSLTMKNTGISVLQYGSWDDESDKWYLLVYNDHSHLG